MAMEVRQTTGSVRICEWILVLAAGALFFSRLDCPLQEPEETLYAEIPRQMLAEDRLLVPVRHGQDYYDKPPLLYWLVMAAYQLCGVHDWAARLVPSSAAFLCVLVSYWWAKRTAGPRAAFAGALMLCLSPRFAQMARMLTTNALLTLWVIAALATAHRGLAGPSVNRRWWLLSALACGMGLLTKGPVALLLVVVPILVYQLLHRRGALGRPLKGQESGASSVGWVESSEPTICAKELDGGFRGLHPPYIWPLTPGLWGIYAAVAGGISLPWFIIVAIRDPAFVDYFFWIHHIRRYIDPIDHLQPAWYYIPILLMGMLPWTLLVPGLVRYFVGRVAADDPQRRGTLGFFLLCGLWSLIFFSASACKRPSYILPAMPPLALALGCYVDAAVSRGRIRLVHWACAVAGCFVLLFGAAQCMLPAYAQRFSLRDQILPHAEAGDGAVPVMCYPHGWDAVSFYLQRSDVRVFRPAQLGEMVLALEQHPESLVVVKSDTSLQSFVTALPASLEFVRCSSQPPVAVGWVRRR
jgi:dolichol-phosphate mannosyltransferase